MRGLSAKISIPDATSNKAPGIPSCSNTTQLSKAISNTTAHSNTPAHNALPSMDLLKQRNQKKFLGHSSFSTVNSSSGVPRISTIADAVQVSSQTSTLLHSHHLTAPEHSAAQQSNHSELSKPNDDINTWAASKANL